jgi:hypothetical protein
LQKALVATLTAYAALTALLGAARVYDVPPNDTPYPYVTIGQSSSRDWSTGVEEGAEHLITFHIWSEKAGRKETYSIAAAIRTALHDAALTLDGHRLVNLRHEFTEARRTNDGHLHHGLTRYRAVTEPL